MSRKIKSVIKRAEDDVETLLRASEDEVVLNMTTNSQTPRGESSYLDPDLQRRFESLRSHKGPYGSASNTGLHDENDLLARFAALKGNVNVVDMDSYSLGIEKSNESEDEVEKVMRWAVDAARVDPSHQSDVEEDDVDDVDDGSGFTSDDDEEEEDRKKGKEGKKKKKKSKQ